MARWGVFDGTRHSRHGLIVLLVQYFILVFALSSATGIQLDGLSTKKPRVTKYTKTTPSPSDTPLPSGNLIGAPAAPVIPPMVSLYRVNSSTGATCILLKTDALLIIKYTNKLGEQMEGDTFIPDNTTVSGNCRLEDSETMTMVFKGFRLVMNFAKTPGGERWYVNGVQLVYNTNNRLFEHVNKPNVLMTLSTPPKHSTLLFPTPVGKSYGCAETAIELENYDPSTLSDQKATILLRDLQLQAFMYKAKNAFGPIFACNVGGSLRDETAPIAVGATLSIAVLGTITGYGIFRYVKVKKVQYDTME